MLLSQGDSCIGSKTSINFGDYKNQLGNFYPPASVFVDIKSSDVEEVKKKGVEIQDYINQHDAKKVIDSMVKKFK